MGKGKRKIHIRKRIAEVLDLPLDALCNMTRVTILSNCQMLIESYDGIYFYSDKEIIITLADKMLSVSGEHLEVEGASDERMMISGVITGLKYGDSV